MVFLDERGRETVLRTGADDVDWIAQPAMCKVGRQLAFTERRVDSELWRVSLER